MSRSPRPRSKAPPTPQDEQSRRGEGGWLGTSKENANNERSTMPDKVHRIVPASDQGHIRATRLERGMLQKEVAELIGVRRGTVNKRECNRGEPRAVDVPRILASLGYDPFLQPKCLRGKMRLWRLRNGLSARAAARLLGVSLPLSIQPATSRSRSRLTSSPPTSKPSCRVPMISSPGQP